MSSKKPSNPPGVEAATATAVTGGKVRVPAFGEGTNDVLGAFRSQFQNFSKI